MSKLAESQQRDGGDSQMGLLRAVTATVNYCQPIDGRALQDVLHPEHTNIPLQPCVVSIKDARPIRDRLSLDNEGFVLLDHKSRYSHMRDKSALEEPYYAELLELISDISGADLVLPSLGVYVRFSPKMAIPGANETTLPAGYVHMDYTRKGFLEQADLVLETAGHPKRDYRRIVLYQTWRGVSEPPHDYPLAVTDGRSPVPGKVVVLENIIGPRDIPGNVTETQLGVYSATDEWYYFANMRADELLLWKGYDTDCASSLNVLHTGFDDTANMRNAKPRESIEARIFAYWE